MNPGTIIKIVLIVVAVLILLYGLSLLQIYDQLSRNKNFWIRHNQQVIKRGQVDYVALGDSAAQGVGATKPQKGYPGLIQTELSARKGREVTLLNLSKSGGKVKDVLDTQLPAYEALKLKNKPIITMEIGANDMVDFEPARFEREMDQLMSKLPEQTVISDIPYFGGSRLGKLEANVVPANEIMYRLADKYGFSLVPLHDKVKANSGITTFAFDFFHPSNKGYRENWAPVFLDAPQLN